MIQYAYILFRCADGRNRHAFHLRFHDLPLRRIVIHKYETFRQNIHLIGYRCDISALRFPVRLDHDKVLGPQNAVRVPQSRDGIVIFILGIDIEHDTDLFLRLHIALKFRIDLPHRSLRPDLQILHAVISYDPSPESIIQIQYQRLLVPAKDSLDDVRQVIGKFRYRLHAHGILIHMPVEGICKAVEAIRSRHVVDIVDIEAGMV